MTTFSNLLGELTEHTRTSHDKGTLFEHLIKKYLETDPQYADRLDEVWLWPEWPDHKGSDAGIDLVARERGSGNYWAIQCKFHGLTHTLQKADIDSFFTASGQRFKTADGERAFSQRLIVSSTDKWSKHAEDALQNQTIPTARLGCKELDASPVDWSRFSLAKVEDMRLKGKKAPRPHQEAAIASIIDGFENSDRGKLIMACGTGKTLVALRLVEKLTAANGRVLLLAPSITLLAQSLREWTAQAREPIQAFAVCSDTKVGRDQEDIRTHDLAYPATTDAEKLATDARAATEDRRTVVFSTYQSIQVLADAQQQGFGAFDLIVCDEAHRTTGLTLPHEDPSAFVKVHDDRIVRGQKRLYMTATPRIYGDASKTKASDARAALFSMDDEKTFGPEFYRLGFGQAVEQDLLSDYKVLIVAVKEGEMAKLANHFNNAYKIDEKKAIDIRFATKIVGSWKGLSKRGLVSVREDGQEEVLSEDTSPMRRALAFSNSIRNSRQTTESFDRLVDLYANKPSGMVDCRLDHVDGAMNALARQKALDWLKDGMDAGECRILSNVRCLAEGIDVPALCTGKTKNQRPEIETVIDTDPKRINWTHNLKADARRNKTLEYEAASIVQSTYRPFCKQWLYFNRRLNERVYQMPKLFPTPRQRNVVISVSGIGAAKDFSGLVADTIPNLHMHDTGQCFPLYWYEKPERKAKPQDEMFADGETPDADGYIRHDAITDWALEAFHAHYGDRDITKEDIFWYVYGILHAPEYTSRFAANLKKMLPRIPFAQDFRTFCDAGRELGDWHLNYETVDPYPLTEDKRLVMEDHDYRVDKMRFGKQDRQPDKTVVAYNAHLVLRDIPLEAYDYVVNGKPAIEWIMERYQVTTDKRSGIRNDPNDWSEDPRYIVDLFKRIVRVSVESARIINSLPPLNEAAGSYSI